MLLRWFKDARKTYNLCLDYVLRHGYHRYATLKDVKLKELQKTLDRLFITKNALGPQKSRYHMLRTPKDIRRQSVKNLISNLKGFLTRFTTRLERRKKFPNTKTFQANIKFDPSFKPLVMNTDTIYCGANLTRFIDASTFGFYVTVKANDNLKAQDQKYHRPTRLKKPERPPTFARIKVSQNALTPAMFDRDAKIHYRLGKFYFLPSLSRPVVPNAEVIPSEQRDSICAVDPGVRKFLTVYSPEGQVNVLGTNTYKVLDKCIRRIDKHKRRLKTFTAKYNRAKRQVSKPVRKNNKTVYIGRSKAMLRPNKQGTLFPLEALSGRTCKKKLRNALWRLKTRYRAAERKAVNVVKNLHYKTAHYLLRRYETVLYPRFNAHSIAQGRLNKKVKRRLNMLSFYKFSTRLAETSTFYTGRKIQRFTEAYTSMQCGQCGTLNDNLKGDEVFKCSKCGIKADRDVHAARNILLRYLE